MTPKETRDYVRSKNKQKKKIAYKVHTNSSFILEIITSCFKLHYRDSGWRTMIERQYDSIKTGEWNGTDCQYTITNDKNPKTKKGVVDIKDVIFRSKAQTPRSSKN